MITSKEQKEYQNLMKDDNIYYIPNTYQHFTEADDKDLQSTYIWLADKYRKKVQSIHQFPWTLYYQIEGSYDPLNNKLFGVHRPGDYVILVFDIDDKKIMLYDDDLFIICLNWGYLSFSEQEDNEIDTYTKCFPKLGIDLYKSRDENYVNQLMNYQQSLLNTYLKMMYKSWENIFNINLPADNWCVAKDKTIMGMTWELNKNELINIIKYNVSEEEYKKYYE